jgi:predicted acyltransferase
MGPANRSRVVVSALAVQGEFSAGRQRAPRAPGYHGGVTTATLPARIPLRSLSAGSRATPDVARSGHRLVALDGLRGLAVVGMLLVDNRGSAAMPAQLQHSAWNGLRLADVVFPLFLFAVGVAMELSGRTARPRAVLARAAKLTLVGCLLVDVRYHTLGPTTGVLQHVAAAYVLTWLVLRLPRRTQPAVVLGTLFAIGAAYRFGPDVLPLPATVQAGWAEGHNLGQWLVTSAHFAFSAESPQSWLPSAANVFAGVLAARLLHRRRGAAVIRLAALAAGCVAAGVLLTAMVPLNKRLWTPSYAVLTSGIAVAVLLVLHLAARWPVVVAALAPLTALGANALTAFALSELVFRAGLGGVQPALVADLQSVVGAVGAAAGYAAISMVTVAGLCRLLARRGVGLRL